MLYAVYVIHRIGENYEAVFKWRSGKSDSVPRDSLFGALKNGAPDAASRVGGRRYFTGEEVRNLAEWYKHRRGVRDGLIQPEDAHDCIA